MSTIVELALAGASAAVALWMFITPRAYACRVDALIPALAELPKSARTLIEAGALAHLVTLNRDGSPQVSCVWMGIADDELVSGHLRMQQKIRNIQRDPRVVVSFEGTRIHPPGLKEYLVVHGRARVTEGGAPELLQRLAYVYLAPDVTFPPMADRRRDSSRGSPSSASAALAPGRHDAARRRSPRAAAQGIASAMTS